MLRKHSLTHGALIFDAFSEVKPASVISSVSYSLCLMVSIHFSYISLEGKFNAQTPVAFNDLYRCPFMFTLLKIHMKSFIPEPLNAAHECKLAFSFPFAL
jgi:hypothetical protein